MYFIFLQKNPPLKYILKFECSTVSQVCQLHTRLPVADSQKDRVAKTGNCLEYLCLNSKLALGSKIW